MYGEPAGADLSRFVEKRLIQVCFGEHQTQLHFDSGDSIVSDVELSVRHGDTYAEWPDAGVLSLFHLLGKAVVSCAFSSERTLKVLFEDKTEIVLNDENLEFESFQILIGGKVFVV